MNEIDREYHEVSNIFPLMDGEEYEQLKADIARNGLREPIWTDGEGKIIDGRNRHRACLDTGTPEKFRTYDGNGSLVNFVISLNLHRRHLSSSQKAAIALDVLPMLEKEAKERQIRKPSGFVSQIIDEQNSRASEQAADIFKTNRQYVTDAKKLKEDAPDLFDSVKSGDITIPEAKKEKAKRDRTKERAELAQSGNLVVSSDRWNVWQGDIQNWQAPRQYDFIITDPPYPREYLPLWCVLAKRAVEWLKPGGLLVAMSGQSYLPEIYEMLGKHLEYYWSAAYLTPGQSPSIWNKSVIPKWKPLLIYSVGKYSGKMFGDVYTSGENSKSFHKWGQSESGMFDVVSGIVLPGQYVLDPFCGAGTTGVAALKHGCFFDGIDVETENVNISKARLNDATKA